MHKAALVPILAAAIGVYACSEETKVKVLKYKLRRAKLEDPRNTLPAKNFDIEIPRANDLTALARALPTTVMSPWTVVGNPRGYGKSFLVKKFGYCRDELYKQHLYPSSGPVLFIDFRDCGSAADAKNRLAHLIDQYSLDPLLLFFMLGTFNTDDIYDAKLRLFRRACRELSDEGHPVIFIMDSMSTLVTQALSGQPSERSQVAGFIRTLFDFNEVLIPVPVASSATTAVNLQRVNGHVFVRTVAHYPNFVSDRAILHEHVRSLCAMHGVAVADEDVAAAVSFYGGCLSEYRVLCMTAQAGVPLADVLAKEMENHRTTVLQLLHLTTAVQSSLREKTLALSCVEVLEILLRDECSITDAEKKTLMSYGHPAVHHLLSCHTPMLPVLGVDPTTLRVTFAIPGTRAILSEPDTVKAIARLKAEVRWKVSYVLTCEVSIP